MFDLCEGKSVVTNCRNGGQWALVPRFRAACRHSRQLHLIGGNARKRHKSIALTFIDFFHARKKKLRFLTSISKK